MAINIQEILHPSDSDAIKFEKINYNFDQIVANGGGPTGQKGALGQQGAAGPQGQKGDKGDTGSKGETGATTSRWKVIASNSGEYDILKPKLEGDVYHPTVFLGDQTFDEVQNQDGFNNFSSTLTLGKHAAGGNAPSDIYLALYHGDVDGLGSSALDVQSQEYSALSDEIGSGVRYKIGPSFNNPQAVDTQIMIDADQFKVGEGTRMSFQGSNSVFKLPTSSITATEAGLLRWTGSLAQVSVESAVAGVYEWKEICLAPCGQGGTAYTIEILPAGDLNLNAAGGLAANSISMTDNSNVTFDANGDIYSGTPEFTSAMANFNVPDGTVGESVAASATVSLGTIQSINPPTYQSGTNTYQGTIQVPASGYSNSGLTVLATDDATGTLATNTYTYNFNEGNSNGNFNIDNVVLNSGGSSGSYAGGTIVVTALPSQTLQFTLTASTVAGREFTTDPISFNGGAGITVVSQTNTTSSATVVFTKDTGTSDETITFTIEAATQSATTTQPTYTVQYINGNTDNYATCQLASPVYNATYQGSSAGAFNVVSTAIANDNSYTGVGGQFCKIVSSDEPNFQWANHIFNHSYTAGYTDCSTVSNTTLPPNYVGSEHTVVNTSNQSRQFAYYKVPATGGGQPVMVVDSPLGAGNSRVVCHWNDSSANINWVVNGEGDPAIPPLTAYGTITDEQSICS